MVTPAPLDAQELQRCVGPVEHARLLPRGAYVDAAVLQWEQHHFFGDWICAGRSADIAEPGMQRAVSVGTSGVLLTRGEGVHDPAADCGLAGTGAPVVPRMTLFPAAANAPAPLMRSSRWTAVVMAIRSAGSEGAARRLLGSAIAACLDWHISAPPSGPQTAATWRGRAFARH